MHSHDLRRTLPGQYVKDQHFFTDDMVPSMLSTGLLISSARFQVTSVIHIFLLPVSRCSVGGCVYHIDHQLILQLEYEYFALAVRRRHWSEGTTFYALFSLLCVIS